MENNTEVLEAKALYELAVDKMRRNLTDEALADLERAARLAPGDPLYISQYGVCLAQRKQLDRGLDFCQRAVKASPRSSQLRVNLGRVYRLAGDAAAAHRHFLEAWRGNKRDSAAALELARMGVRRRPMIPFLSRTHWCNRELGRLRHRLVRSKQIRPLR